MPDEKKVYYVKNSLDLGNGLHIDWQKVPHEDGEDRYVGVVVAGGHAVVVASQGHANKHRSLDELVFEAGRAYEQAYARPYIEETIAVMLEFPKIRDEVMGRLRNELQRHLRWSNIRAL